MPLSLKRSPENIFLLEAAGLQERNAMNTGHNEIQINMWFRFTCTLALVYTHLAYQGLLYCSITLACISH